WGKGRPGWHIECSVMSMDTLGPTLDIHGGGQDLIFPHHENEIAQSEAYTGKPFVRYWLHNGFVTVEKEKMSKSLGNFATVREVLQRYDPQTLRFFLLSTHYRKPLDFSERAVKDVQKGLLRIQNTIFNLKNALEYARTSGKEEFRGEIERAKKGFVTALEDDFNVPKALAVFFDFIRAANTYAAENPEKEDLKHALGIINELADVLGLTFEEEVPPLIRELMEIIIKGRSYMRARKDFTASDEIRKRLERAGIVLEDRRQGTVWRFTVPLESQQ
ncbi:MAG: DALR domain-containing protein, partial [Candidatus Hydrothermarchaeales archaeon]